VLISDHLVCLHGNYGPQSYGLKFVYKGPALVDYKQLGLKDTVEVPKSYISMGSD